VSPPLEISMATVEQELELLRITANKGKNRQAYLHELADALDKACDDDPALWKSLSHTAQTWFNDASHAVGTGVLIPDFISVKAPTIMTKHQNGKARKAPAKAKPKTAAVGAPTLIRKLVIKKRDISNEELAKKLKE